jgi:hypothetical protein
MPDLTTLEYPRHVHQPSVAGAWITRLVRDAEACAAALAEGWSLAPILIDPARPRPASPAPPADPVAPVKRGPGRPRKVDR